MQTPAIQKPLALVRSFWVKTRTPVRMAPPTTEAAKPYPALVTAWAWPAVTVLSQRGRINSRLLTTGRKRREITSLRLELTFATPGIYVFRAITIAPVNTISVHWLLPIRL